MTYLIDEEQKRRRAGRNYYILAAIFIILLAIGLIYYFPFTNNSTKEKEKIASLGREPVQQVRCEVVYCPQEKILFIFTEQGEFLKSWELK